MYHKDLFSDPPILIQVYHDNYFIRKRVHPISPRFDNLQEL